MPKGKHRVADGTRVYAIGDLHGRSDLLASMHDMIGDDVAKSAPSRVVIVYIGDYIDRGEGGRAVIEILSNPSADGIERVFLRGNHEDLMLRFLEGGGPIGTWLMNGGIATLRGYGIEWKEGRNLDGAEEARQNLIDALPERHVSFLRGLVHTHEEGDYLFVHAGVRPGIALDRQDVHDLMWIRERFLDSRADFGRRIVHGHTVSPVPQILDNRIGIDTGAYKSDVLTCVVLEADGLRILQT